MSELQDPEIFRAVLDSLHTGVYLVDRDRKIAFWNDGAEKISGYLRQDVIGRCCCDDLLVHCDENNCVLCGTGCPLTATMRDGQPREAEVYLLHKAGHRVPAYVRAVPIRNRQGVIIGAAEAFEERCAAPQTNRRHGGFPECDHPDELTGMPNREFTRECLRRSLADFGGSHVPFGILLIEVDRLDQFQATHGQQAEAAILRAAARTMKNCLRQTELLGCWTENRFLAVIAVPSNAIVEKVGERLRKIVKCATVQWWGDPLSVTISQGGTLVRPGDTAESVLERAEELLRQSGAKGGDCLTVA